MLAVTGSTRIKSTVTPIVERLNRLTSGTSTVFSAVTQSSLFNIQQIITETTQAATQVATQVVMDNVYGPYVASPPCECTQMSADSYSPSQH